MLPLKLVRSLFLGDTILPFNQTDDTHVDKIATNNNASTRIPFILFIPTNELIQDTYKLATLARNIGMDLSPNPSLSHIFFSWPNSPPSLSNNVIPLPFPSLSTASLSHLRLFTNLSKGFFKLVFLKSSHTPFDKMAFYSSNSNWDVSTLSLVCKKTGARIDNMDKFTTTLLGLGWSLFKSKDSVVYLYRRLDLNRVQVRWTDCAKDKENGISSAKDESCRVRELRLPLLNFKNVPLRILQYILLMTDDVFYLA